MPKPNPLAALVGFATASIALVAQQPALFASRIFPTPPLYYGSQVADLDGDGRLDLVYLAGSNGLGWRRGDGSGGFEAPLPLLPASGTLTPNVIATADADGDADLDLYLAIGLQSHLEIWLNSGSGSFQLGGSTQLGSALVMHSAAFDANGDSRLDIVHAEKFSAGGVFSESLWLSTCTAGGGLAPPVVQFGIANAPFYTASADLDLDGDRDLVLWPQLKVSQNQGSAFAPPVASPLGSFFDQIRVAGDLDGNGSEDLVAASGLNWNSVACNGALGFLAPAALPAPSTEAPPGAADWDLDGDLDLCFSDGELLRVLLGDGVGGFQVGPAVALGTDHSSWLGLYELDGAAPRELLTMSAQRTELCVTRAPASGAYAAYESIPLPLASDELHGADLDGDGRIDLVAEPLLGASVATILLGGPVGAPALDLQGAVSALRLADVDGDGACDCIGTGAGGLRFALGNGAGGFGAPQTHPLGLGGNDLELADFDTDGMLDLLLATGNLPSICSGGASGFGAPAQLPPPVPPIAGTARNAASADIDGDGIPDPIASVRTVSQTTPVRIAAWRSGGGISYAAPFVVQVFATGTFDPSFPVLCGDFDGDQRVDLCCTDGTQTALVAYGDGQGAFAAPSAVGGSTSLFGQLGLPFARADLDLDGRDDLGVTGSVATANVLRVWRGGSAGSGPFVEPESYATVALGSLAAFDLDSDGRVELLGSSAPGAAPRLLVFRAPGGLGAGMTPFGVGTPGCQGTQALVGSAVPQVGASDFRLICHGAPPQTVGLGLIGAAQDPGSDPLGIGLALHVGLGAPLVPFHVQSSASGSAARLAPIPNDPLLVGATLYAQFVWPWSASASCDPSPFGLSSTRGLALTIQP